MQNAEEAIFPKISKCGFFRRGTFTTIFANFDTSFFLLVFLSHPLAQVYVYIFLCWDIFSPFSFFPPSQFSHSPYALHFPLVQGCVISLSSRVLTGTLSARFFSHCDILQPSLELGWPPWCSFCDYTNLIHTDRREVKVWSSMDSGARLPRCEPCLWYPPATWPWPWWRSSKSWFLHLQNGGSGVSLLWGCCQSEMK